MCIKMYYNIRSISKAERVRDKYQMSITFQGIVKLYTLKQVFWNIVYFVIVAKV